MSTGGQQEINMATVFMDGFEYTLANDAAGHWHEASVYGSSDITYGNTGRTGNCAYFDANGINEYAILTHDLTTPASTLYVGIALKWVAYTGASGNSRFLSLNNPDGDPHLTFGIEAATGKLTVWRGSETGTELGQGNTFIKKNVWYHIQIKAVIDDSSGEVEVRVNGVTSPAMEIDIDTVDTKEGSSANVELVKVTANAYTAFYVDDFIINDTSGSDHNSWTTRSGIYKLTPNADGTYEDWSLSTGSDTYALLDEDPPDTADYISSSTSAHQSTVGVSHSVPAGATVGAVMVFSQAALSGPGSTTYYHMVRAGSTDDTKSAAHAPDVTPEIFYDIWQVDPYDSTAWTKADLDALEIGVEVA
jgi:hypothetical protein